VVEGVKYPLDVGACLSGMAPNGASVNDTQPRAILSLLQKAIHPADVIETVVNATMEVADAAQLGWRRDEEVRCVTRRCLSSLKILHDEYDPSTGVIPTWLAGEFHQAWADLLLEGKRPQLSRNPHGWYVRGWPLKDSETKSPDAGPRNTVHSDRAAEEIQVSAFPLRGDAARNRAKLSC
jgi:hypothetical protein